MPKKARGNNDKHFASSGVTPSPFSYLPMEIVQNIAMYMPQHVCLRLVCRKWNNDLTHAHISEGNPLYYCTQCVCRTDPADFQQRRVVLPWIRRWTLTSSALSGTNITPSSSLPMGEVDANLNIGEVGQVNLSHCRMAFCAEDWGAFKCILLDKQLDSLESVDINILATTRRGSFPANPDPSRLIIKRFQQLEGLESLSVHSLDMEYGEWTALDMAEGNHDDINSDDPGFEVVRESVLDLDSMISSLRRLRTADFSSCRFPTSALRFVGCPPPTTLEVLRISSSSLPSDTIPNMLSTAFCINLKTLDIEECKENSDRNILALCHAADGTLPHLEALSASSCALTDIALRALGRSRLARQLKRLLLPNNLFSGRGICSFLAIASSRSVPFASLQQLDISNADNGEITYRRFIAEQAARVQVAEDEEEQAEPEEDEEAHEEAPDAGEMMPEIEGIHVAAQPLAENRAELDRLMARVMARDQRLMEQVRQSELHAEVEERGIGVRFPRRVHSKFAPSSALFSIRDEEYRNQTRLSLSIGDIRHFGSAAVQALGCIPWMHAVESLELKCCTPTAASLLFGHSSRINSLKHLRIFSREMNWQTLQQVVSSPLHCRQVQSLTLITQHTFRGKEFHSIGNSLDDECCRILANSSHLQFLAKIELGCSVMSISNGFIPLLTSPHLPALVHLDCKSHITILHRANTRGDVSMSVEGAAELIGRYLINKTVNPIRFLRFPHTVFGRDVCAQVNMFLKLNTSKQLETADILA